MPFIVGIGASAGGLEAATQLLSALPPQIDFAIVLVQHLAPEHESFLPHLLAASTVVPVIQAEHDLVIEPGHVFVIPPDRQIGVRQGRITLGPRPKDRTQHMPIDFFFRALAEDAQARAIGVVLSGTMSDGAIGLREIKGAGGVTIAQEPRTAKFDGMPRAAIATGAVDLVLPPAQIAAELVRLVGQSPLAAVEPPEHEEQLRADDQLNRVFQILRSATGVDFTHYKLPTIRRRMQRRMVLHRVDGLEKYVQILRNEPAEVSSLYQDLLIHVTRFFRNPDSFDALAQRVFPEIVTARGDSDPVRVWVPGCSTGEEAYSVAIALVEFLGEERASRAVQIFATDVSETAIERARAGIYPESISADVSPERLRRFFNRVDGSYRISKAIRDRCIFARQDLTRDPPFSRLDMILCRNVLIYLGPVLQRRLINIFHYALNPAGFLVLGGAESIGAHAELFSEADKRHKIFAKRANATVAPDAGADFQGRLAGHARPALNAPAALTRGGGGEVRSGRGSLQSEINRALLSRFTPPGVVINADLKIVQFRGQTGPFLEPVAGDASLDLFRMVREGLLFGLRSAVLEARRSDRPVRREGLRVAVDGSLRQVTVEVIPITPTSEGRHLLVVFHLAEPSPAAQAAPLSKGPHSKQGRHPKDNKADHPAGKGKRTTGPDVNVAALEQELLASREFLQATIQDLEAANEELQSANEEILSSNEELQSTNEELDTAKEELQSSNEELNTLNEELQGRNEELSRVNSDLVNLLGSVHIPIVMVTADLRIRRFTPMAEKLFNLIPGDVGRSIGDIKPRFPLPDLQGLIEESVTSVALVAREVQDGEGHWFRLAVRPYKSLDNRIDGAVLALFEAGPSRQMTRDLEDAQASVTVAHEERDIAREIVQAVRQPLVLLDDHLSVITVNKAFLQTFAVSSTEVEGQSLQALAAGRWNVGRLRELLRDVQKRGTTFEDFKMETELPGSGPRQYLLSARRVQSGEHAPFVLLTFELSH